jgi:hypothetical protein
MWQVNQLYPWFILRLPFNMLYQLLNLHSVEFFISLTKPLRGLEVSIYVKVKVKVIPEKA